jgi:hypothetical protein
VAFVGDHRGDYTCVPSLSLLELGVVYANLSTVVD